MFRIFLGNQEVLLQVLKVPIHEGLLKEDLQSTVAFSFHTSLEIRLEPVMQTDLLSINYAQLLFTDLKNKLYWHR